jgi:LytR cell envelope-related transcriptional attenuator
MTQPGRPPGRSSGGTQTGKAVLVIAIVVLVGWWVLLKSSPSSRVASGATTTSLPTTTVHQPTTPTTAATALIPPPSIKLQVLNGLLTGNLAGQWSTKLKANPGYNTLTPDNATAKVAASVIYVMTPGYQREANALAVAVGLPVTVVNQTVPAPATAPIPAAERTTANLVLIIGPDLAGRA